MCDEDSRAAPDFTRGVPSSGGSVLPVVTQDADNGRVLMLAWMNQESLELTLKTKRAVYYSRSRRGLWRKGDTSGHEQHVERIEVDCDGDTILLHVRQVGAACHEGYRSCFFRKVNDDGSKTITEEKIAK
ncbi:MAG: phosphoribosyl-AMP cyclohydrolase [Planctomycetota bacterium]